MALNTAEEVADVPQAEKLETCQKEVKDEDEKAVTASISFKEETNVVAELPDPQKKALDELKSLVQEALNKHEFTSPTKPCPVAESECKQEQKDTTPSPPESCIDEDGAKKIEAIQETIVAVTMPAEPTKKTEEEVSIWGIPLLADERSDVVLLKFLRARDFKAKEAFTMLKNVVAWRKEFGIESLLEEEEADLGREQEKVVFMHGVDKEGHPVCYNAYGEYQNQETFSDDEKRKKFLRWRIRFLEKSIRKLDFSPHGISTIVQVNDLKYSPAPFKKELRQVLQLLQDNYPEFVAKQVPSIYFSSSVFLHVTKWFGDG